MVVVVRGGSTNVVVVLLKTTFQCACGGASQLRHQKKNKFRSRVPFRAIIAQVLVCALFCVFVAAPSFPTAANAFLWRGFPSTLINKQASTQQKQQQQQQSGGDYANPGPFGVGHRYINVPRSRWIGPAQPIAAVVVYPAEGVHYGPEREWAQKATPAPVMVWAPGWTCLVEQYASLTTHLASHGIASVIPMAWHGDAIPSFDQDAEDLLRIVDWLADGARSERTLQGRINPGAIAVGGHSSGGATILEVVARDGRRFANMRRIRAAVSLSPSEFALADGRGMDYGGVSAGQVLGYVTAGDGDNRKPGDGWRRIANYVRAPLLLLSGELDKKTRNFNNANMIFRIGRSAPKLQITLRRGSHCFLEYGSRVSGGVVSGGSITGWPVPGGDGSWAPEVTTRRDELWDKLFYGAGGDSECPESAIFSEMLHPKDQLRLTRKLIGEWLALYLLGDNKMNDRLWGKDVWNSTTDNTILRVSRRA